MRTIALIFIIMSTACNEGVNERQDIDIVKNFVASVVTNDSFDISTIGEYVHAQQTPLDDAAMQEVLSSYISYMRETIGKNSGKYEIVRSDSGDHRKLIEDYDLQYDDTMSTFYLVAGEKLVTHIIVKEGKVISFFTSITKKKRNRYPWIL